MILFNTFFDHVFWEAFLELLWLEGTVQNLNIMSFSHAYGKVLEVKARM